jgi:hypothetical protein
MGIGIRQRSGYAERDAAGRVCKGNAWGKAKIGVKIVAYYVQTRPAASLDLFGPLHFFIISPHPIADSGC